MAIVAIAGGTGGVGKTVVEHLQRYGDHHKVFVIGRKVTTLMCTRYTTAVLTGP